MAILFDLDGVFYQSDKAIVGAAEVVHWASENAIPYLFLTNTSSRPRSSLVEKLSGFGIETDQTHILTPAVAAVHWLKENMPLGKIALFVPEKTKFEFSEFEFSEHENDVSAVVIGDLSNGWDFNTLNGAFQLLMSASKPKLIALGMTRYWQSEAGLCLDVAPFVMALSYAAEVKPVIVGKPALAFYKVAIDLLQEDADKIVMVGDDIRADIEAAQQVGLKAVLVRTGKFRESDLELGIKPTAVIDSVAELPSWFEKMVKREKGKW